MHLIFFVGYRIKQNSLKAILLLISKWSLKKVSINKRCLAITHDYQRKKETAADIRGNDSVAGF